MVEGERNWLEAKIGLIPEHDDDVMYVQHARASLKAHWTGTSRNGPAALGFSCVI